MDPFSSDDPLALEGLGMLTDGDLMLGDPAVEDSFRSDHLKWPVYTHAWTLSFCPLTLRFSDDQSHTVHFLLQMTNHSHVPPPIAAQALQSQHALHRIRLMQNPLVRLKVVVSFRCDEWNAICLMSQPIVWVWGGAIAQTVQWQTGK